MRLQTIGEAQLPPCIVQNRGVSFLWRESEPSQNSLMPVKLTYASLMAEADRSYCYCHQADIRYFDADARRLVDVGAASYQDGRHL